MEAVILMGIQAAGKSTFYARRFADSHVRLNLDMLVTRRREGLLLQALIAAKARFVVDNTNATRELRRRYVAPAKAAGFRARGFYFSSVLADCVERNARRREPVPEAALRGTLAQLEPPSYAEGFDELFYVRFCGDEFVVQEYRDEHGIEFEKAPLWQKRGVSLSWELYEKIGVDPRTAAATVARRRRISMRLDLPRADEYAAYVRARISGVFS